MRIGNSTHIPVATGNVYHWLTVTAKGKKVKSFQYWICQCICGEIRTIQAASLRSGNTKSCGCYKQICSVTHGMSDSDEYHTWENMIARCKGATEQMKKDYVDRGITVCEEWKTFDGFFKDMRYKPPGMTLERKDNDKGYYKDNCEWADSKVQANNRRTSS